MISVGNEIWDEPLIDDGCYPPALQALWDEMSRLPDAGLTKLLGSPYHSRLLSGPGNDRTGTEPWPHAVSFNSEPWRLSNEASVGASKILQAIWAVMLRPGTMATQMALTLSYDSSGGAAKRALYLRKRMSGGGPIQKSKLCSCIAAFPISNAGSEACSTTSPLDECALLLLLTPFEPPRVTIKTINDKYTIMMTGVALTMDTASCNAQCASCVRKHVHRGGVDCRAI